MREVIFSQDSNAQKSEPLMPFEDYIKAKKKLGPFVYLTALPFSCVGLFGSSAYFAFQYPNLFSPQEEVELIM